MSTNLKTTTASPTTNVGVVKLFKDIYLGRGNSNPAGFTQFHNRLYFAATDPGHGTELWVSDGTPRGTYLLKDIRPGRAGAAPANLIGFGNNLYFSADDNTHGRELWQSDGTTLGTILLKDIESYPYSSSSPRHFVPVGNKLFFITTEGQLNPTTNLCVTDGTTRGTQELIRGQDIIIPKPFTAFEGKFYSTELESMRNINYMRVIDSTNNTTLWIKPIDSPSNPFEFSGKLYFTAEDSTHGAELWVSDGTADGTHLFKDINPAGSSSASNFGVLSNWFYFTANDGIHGNELWVSDGTTNGTQLVKDINPAGSSSPSNFGTLSGNKLFFSANDGIHGNELWVSDGTPVGTQLVKNIKPIGNSDPQSLLQCDGKLYFTADDGTHGRELWVSNGTTTGTQLVRDINPGSNGSDLSNFKQFDSRLYFTGDDGVHGTELWVLDPRAETLSGTSRRDALDGKAGDDTLLGLGGNDTLIGGNGEDTLDGGIGNDTLSAGNGDDRLYGSTGNDRLLGGNGQDFLSGGLGYNVLVGNQERDTFVLHRQGFALIRDFTVGSDRLSLPRGVRFRDLDILQQGNASILEVGDRSIAKLLGVLPSALRASSFV